MVIITLVLPVDIPTAGADTHTSMAHGSGWTAVTLVTRLLPFLSPDWFAWVHPRADQHDWRRKAHGDDQGNTQEKARSTADSCDNGTVHPRCR